MQLVYLSVAEKTLEVCATDAGCGLISSLGMVLFSQNATRVGAKAVCILE